MSLRARIQVANIEMYEKRRGDLLAEHGPDKWVMLHGGKIVSTGNNPDEAQITAQVFTNKLNVRHAMLIQIGADVQDAFTAQPLFLSPPVAAKPATEPKQLRAAKQVMEAA